MDTTPLQPETGAGDAELGLTLPAPSPAELELQTMLVLLEVIDTLDPDQRRRVLAWISDYYAVPAAGAPAMGPTEDQIVKAAAAWVDAVLGSMDAAELEQGSLDGLGWGSAGSLAEHLLNGIRARVKVAAGELSPEALWRST